MRMLRCKTDWKTLFVVTLYFVSTAIGWIYFTGLPVWAKVLVVGYLCVLSFMCSVIVHNTVHVPVFYKKSYNKLFQIILSMTYGYPVSPFVIGHNLSHHQHTGRPKDIARTSNLRFKWNFLNQALFFFITSDSIMRSEWLWIKRVWKAGHRSWVIQYLLELTAVGLFKFSFLILNWKVALLMVWLPHLWAQWGIVGTNYWQHDGCDIDHPYNHSRNFTNRLLNSLVFNNGYHGLHHNEPTLHWSKLPEVYYSRFRQHLHPNLDRNSLLAYLWESCIWPGKRMDYLGKKVVLPVEDANTDLGWVPNESIVTQRIHMGAEQPNLIKEA